MPIPEDMMLFVVNRIIKDEMNKREYTYEEHKEIERTFNDFYDAVMCNGTHIEEGNKKFEKKKSNKTGIYVSV